MFSHYFDRSSDKEEFVGVQYRSFAALTRKDLHANVISRSDV
jgi:hypothetical protein